MGNTVYPALPGLAWDLNREVMPPPVVIKTTPSLREYRARDATLTRYRYTQKYEFLRGAAAYQELQTLLGFYNGVGGPFDSFLYLDSNDNAATNNLFGVGDGATLSWQLLRTVGGFSEGVAALVSIPSVMYNGGNLNLLQQGAAFDQSPWGGTCTVIANTAANPVTAAVDADTVQDSSTSVLQNLIQGITILDPTDASQYTASIYVKKTTGGTSKTFRFNMGYTGGSGSFNEMRVNTDTGVILAQFGPSLDSASVVDAGSGWWRLIMTAHNSGLNTSLNVSFNPAYAPYNSSTLDNTVTGSAIVYGAKLETSGSVGGFTSRYYTVSQYTGVVTISPAPNNGDQLTWTGQFYWRCRFEGDSMDYDEFMDNLFSASGIKFITTRV